MANIPTGLTGSEAAARLRRDGPNELSRPQRRTWFKILFEVLREPMFALLLAGGLIYLVLGNPEEAIFLLFFATLSVTIAVVQNLRSERVLETLRSLASPRALVVRDGRHLRIPGREVVAGDLLIISEGDRVAADGIVRETSDLRVDESALTGESVPVSKHTADQALQNAPQPGGDDTPFVFAGTLVVGGQGFVEVTATGPRSQMGAIGLSLAHIQTEAPRTAQEIRKLVAVWGGIGVSASLATTILYGLLRGGWLEGVLAGIAIGMSLLPEEFPLTLTVFMVMGAWRISKARVLTRRPSAIEYLGAATVLCVDKTGTLTENRMKVAAIATPTQTIRISGSDTRLPDTAHQTLRIGRLASRAESLDPMEKAIHVLAEAAFGGTDESSTLLHTYPLRPDLMAMSHVWQTDEEERFVAAKGASEAILRLCRLSAEEAAPIRSRADALASEGMRVIGVAHARIGDGTRLPDDHLGVAFEFVGLLGLSDPLRATVPESIQDCRNAGIRVIMITGDYPATALAVARQAGIETQGILVGHDLDAMSDAALTRVLATVNVCARITPLQKLRIVTSLKASGEVVAMTGDGVNDAPSLKAADIGVAMGGRGTDVAREASSIVLLDDEFTSIVAAIRLGRRIYDNLRKAISFIMAVHLPIAGLALLPLILGYPMLFFPVHIAFLEMLIDPVCSLAFEAERDESDVMRRAPRPVHQRIVTRAMIAWAFVQGVVVLALVAGLYAVSLKMGIAEGEARALTFIAIVTGNTSLILVNRSFHRRSILQMLGRGNRALWAVLSLVAAALCLVLAIAPIRGLFAFGALSVSEIAAAAGTGIAALVILNTGKVLAPLARGQNT